MTMRSDTGLFGWQQDLLNLVQKGLVTVCSIDWQGEGPESLRLVGTAL